MPHSAVSLKTTKSWYWKPKYKRLSCDCES